MHIGIVTFLFSFFIFNPSEVKKDISVEVLPVQIIKLDFTTPALAAYKDSLTSNLKEEQNTKTETLKVNNLVSGITNKSFETQITKIQKDYINRDKNLVKERIIVFRKPSNKAKNKKPFNLLAYNTRYTNKNTSSVRSHNPTSPTKPTKNLIKPSDKPTAPGDKKTTDVANRDVKKDSVSLINDKPLPVYLKGQVIFNDKLKYSELKHYVQIYRSFNREAAEEGAFDFKDKTFMLESQSWGGQLVVDLRNSSTGALLGRGAIELTALAVNKNQDIVDNINIVVSAFKQGLVGYVKSTKSAGLPLDTVIELTDIKEAQELANTSEFQFTNIIEGSKLISKTTANKHWATIQIIDSNVSNKITLHHKDTVESMIALAKGEEALKSDWSVVIGKVVNKGKPVVGAVVEFVDDNSKATYFNGFIPDEKLNQTTVNGEFAFIGGLAGAYSLRYYVIDPQTGYRKYSPSQEVIIATNHVSNIDFISRGEKELVVDVVDLNDKYLVNNVAFQIAGKILPEDRNEFNFLNLPKNNYDLFLKYEPSKSHMSLNHIVDTHAEHIKLPAISIKVEEAIEKLDSLDGTGSILLYNVQDSEQVFLDNNIENENTKRIYLNKSGEQVDQSKATFTFIYNVEPGLRSIIISDNNSEKIYTKIVLIDSEVPVLVQ